MSIVFSDQQLSSIILGLEKGDIALKYSYITKNGAKARQKLEKQRTDRGQSFSDNTLLKNSIEIYLQELGNPKHLAIFDFGCGTGETVKDTIQELNKIGVTINYHAFDISQNIIDLCQQNISTIKNCSFNYSIIDFETSNLINILHNIRTKYKNIPVLGLLLGNTVGNFNSMERILTNILEAFRIGDKLCIGTERVDIQNKRWYDSMMKEYNSKDVFEVFWATMEELGFDISNGKYEIIFNERLSTVEAFFVIEKDFNIKIKKQKLSFKKGEKIKIGHSKKIDESLFSKLFLDLNMRVANLRTNKSNTYLQALIGSKKY